jgi:hypothetical protein
MINKISDNKKQTLILDDYSSLKERSESVEEFVSSSVVSNDQSQNDSMCQG